MCHNGSMNPDIRKRIEYTKADLAASPPEADPSSQTVVGMRGNTKTLTRPIAGLSLAVILGSMAFWIPFLLVIVAFIYLAELANQGVSGTEYLGLLLIPVVIFVAISGLFYIWALYSYSSSNLGTVRRRKACRQLAQGLTAMYGLYVAFLIFAGIYSALTN